MLFAPCLLIRWEFTEFFTKRIMIEIWKEIKGFEGRYEISSEGRVRNMKKGNILVASKNEKGYLRLRLGRGKDYRVHRLVAEAFIPNPNNKPCVDHINAIRDDNRVENLRWVTHTENNLNPITFERLTEKSGKDIVQLSLKGVALNYFRFMQLAENHTGVIRQDISDCRKGKRQTAGGYRWLSFEDYERFY